jgi:hypothetical protein
VFSPRIYLSLYLTIVLSTNTQSWHDYNAFRLPNSTGQYELIDMSHDHESCMSRFLLIYSLMGCKGSLCLGGVYGLLKGQQSPELHMELSEYGLLFLSNVQSQRRCPALAAQLTLHHDILKGMLRRAVHRAGIASALEPAFCCCTPICVPWPGQSGLRYVWSSEKI